MIRTLKRIVLAGAITLAPLNHATAQKPDALVPAGLTPEELARQSAGDDLDALTQHVQSLAVMAQRHIEEVGLARALLDFRAHPWKREANGLHIWGVTVTGMSWFDAGHPEIIGLDVRYMADLTGKIWWPMSVASANGEGDAVFEILYPHPNSLRAARGRHTCFPLKDGQRLLCAGAYEEL